MARTFRVPLSVLLLALAAAGMSLVINRTVLDGIPHVTDETAYLFQARIFLQGRLCLDPPPLPELFRFQNILLDQERWCSPYPPGWPLLLMLGWLVHAPWVVSPLLLGLAVIGVWALGRSLFDPLTGKIAAAALAASPFALLMAAGFMAHVPTLCAAVWCLAALAEGALRPRPKALVAAGALGGFAFLIRPFTALALLAPAVVWCLVHLWRERRWLPALGWMAAGALPFLAIFLAYNQVVFGGPLTIGYEAYNPERFGHLSTTFVPAATAFGEALPWYLRHVNRALWGWPWPDLLILLPLLWPRPGRGRDAMLATCFAGLVLAYCFYHYRDIIYATPRFAFEGLGPLSVLAARSLLILRDGLDRLLGRTAAARRTARMAVLAAGAAVLLFVPLGRLLPELMVHHSQWYLATSAEPLRRAVQAGVGPEALVFVSGTPWCYASFYLATDLPPQTGKRVFVPDIPPLRAAALRIYARPEVWVVRVVVTVPDPVAAPELVQPVEISWHRLR